MGNKTYPTPDLIGSTLHEAIAQTSPLHVNIQLTGEKECAGIVSGTIISQKPTAGRLIKPHQSIMVTTCKAPQTTLAPNLAHVSPAKAKNLCAAQKIKLKIYEITSPFPQGTYIGQMPQADHPLTDKKLILYTAKNNTDLYLMPKLINKNMLEVLDFLQKNNVTAEVFYQHQKLIEPYPDQDNVIVVTQNPAPGSLVNLEKQITVQLEVL